MSFLYVELTRRVRLLENEEEFWADYVDYMRI